jgi:hypothetical protein
MMGHAWLDVLSIIHHLFNPHRKWIGDWVLYAAMPDMKGSISNAEMKCFEKISFMRKSVTCRGRIKMWTQFFMGMFLSL